MHEQISRQVRAQILAGQLADGDALPSIRALARQEKVSVITVQRAYDDLLREGLLVSRRGKGFFTAPISQDQKRNTALERLLERLRTVVDEARAEGLDDAQIRRVVDQTMEEK
ncbi:MAG: GntR family transcriptional regulator [Rhodospirillaceae bacterium]|nr:GntR family transcriptional regulator [Rhodospirillaceae bacterium]